MPSPLTIWCNARFGEPAQSAFVEGTSGGRLLQLGQETSNLQAAKPSDLLYEAEIAFGQPDPDQLLTATTVKWVHLTTAGYTRYDRPDLRQAFADRGAVLTNSSSVYDEPCAEHLLAFMLAQARQLPQCLLRQVEKREWAYEGIRPITQILRGQSVVILGYGAIARRLIELLAPFRMNVTAVRRKVAGDEVVTTVAIDDMGSVLPTADHVVNALPANRATEGIIGSQEFGAMKPGAQFYNVGRGNTVDQRALVEVLESGRLAGAYLDVTDPEPLPPESPLWITPNCYITPHIGGGFVDEESAIVGHFLENLERFKCGAPFTDRVF